MSGGVDLAIAKGAGAVLSAAAIGFNALAHYFGVNTGYGGQIPLASYGDPPNENPRVDLSRVKREPGTTPYRPPNPLEWRGGDPPPPDRAAGAPGGGGDGGHNDPQRNGLLGAPLAEPLPGGVMVAAGGGGGWPAPGTGAGILLIGDAIRRFRLSRDEQLDYLELANSGNLLTTMARRFSRKKRSGRWKLSRAVPSLRAQGHEVKTLTRTSVSRWDITGDPASTRMCFYTSSADCTDFSTYQSLYDEYRIAKMELTFMPGYTSGAAPAISMVAGVDPETSTQVAQAIPIYVARDYDDSNVTTGTWASVSAAVTEINRYLPCWRWHSLDGKTHKVACVPHVNTSVISTGSTSVAGGNVAAPWLRTTVANIEAYGIKAIADTVNVAVPTMTSGAPLAFYTVIKSITFQFRVKH